MSIEKEEKRMIENTPAKLRNLLVGFAKSQEEVDEARHELL